MAPAVLRRKISPGRNENKIVEGFVQTPNRDQVPRAFER